jgi:hypothetical protein
VHVARMGEIRISISGTEGLDRLEDGGIGWSIILK